MSALSPGWLWLSCSGDSLLPGARFFFLSSLTVWPRRVLHAQPSQNDSCLRGHLIFRENAVLLSPCRQTNDSNEVILGHPWARVLWSRLGCPPVSFRGLPWGHIQTVTSSQAWGRRPPGESLGAEGMNSRCAPGRPGAWATSRSLGNRGRPHPTP